MMIQLPISGVMVRPLSLLVNFSLCYVAEALQVLGRVKTEASTPTSVINCVIKKPKSKQIQTSVAHFYLSESSPTITLLTRFNHIQKFDPLSCLQGSMIHSRSNRLLSIRPKIKTLRVVRLSQLTLNSTQYFSLLFQFHSSNDDRLLRQRAKTKIRAP